MIGNQEWGQESSREMFGRLYFLSVMPGCFNVEPRKLLTLHPGNLKGFST